MLEGAQGSALHRCSNAVAMLASVQDVGAARLRAGPALAGRLSVRSGMLSSAVARTAGALLFCCSPPALAARLGPFFGALFLLLDTLGLCGATAAAKPLAAGGDWAASETFVFCCTASAKACSVTTLPDLLRKTIPCPIVVLHAAPFLFLKTSMTGWWRSVGSSGRAHSLTSMQLSSFCSSSINGARAPTKGLFWVSWLPKFRANACTCKCSPCNLEICFCEALLSNRSARSFTNEKRCRRKHVIGLDVSWW